MVFIGGKLGQPIGEAIGLGGQNERATVGGAVVGAGATWAAGAMMGAPAGPVGIAVGAVVGGVVGLVTGGKRCLIVTACTDSNSYEVEITAVFIETLISMSNNSEVIIVWLKRLCRYLNAMKRCGKASKMACG